MMTRKWKIIEISEPIISDLDLYKCGFEDGYNKAIEDLKTV